MAGGPQPVSIHNSINLPIRKSRLKWIVELLNGPGQPPISSSPTNPNQADASLCLCVQFLIGGLYCYNTFWFHQFQFINESIDETKKKIKLFDFLWLSWLMSWWIVCCPLHKEKINLFFNYGVKGYMFLAHHTHSTPSNQLNPSQRVNNKEKSWCGVARLFFN